MTIDMARSMFLVHTVQRRRLTAKYLVPEYLPKDL